MKNRIQSSILIFFAIMSLNLYAATIKSWTVDEENYFVTKCSDLIVDKVITDTKNELNIINSKPLPSGIKSDLTNFFLPRVKMVCKCTVTKIKNSYSNEDLLTNPTIFKQRVLSLRASKLDCAKYFEEQVDEFSNPKFRQQLLNFVKRDQEIRQNILGKSNFSQNELKKFDTIDNKIQQELAILLKKFGWPRKKDIGVSGLDALALLIIHADNVTRTKALPYFELLYEKGEITGQNIALLTDKILIANGKKQRYGTQLKLVNGKLQASVIEDAAHVDARRSKMGIPSLESYLNFAQKMADQKN